MSDPARLTVHMSDGSSKEYPLDADVVVIGRDPSCEIHIDSRYVSRRHARIRRVDDGFVVEDAQSTNGLKINGFLVREPHPLTTGDCVMLGDVSLTYEGSDDSMATIVYSAGTPIAVATRPDQLASDAKQRPAGLRSILFTDLVDHTREVVRVGDLAGQLWLRRYISILREQFQHHDGMEEKWTGDGFVVTFDSARRTVQCAIAIQRAISDYNSATVEGTIHVRVGLNSGEILREEGELFGNAVILAARIMSQAGGEQILISELMYRLVEPSAEFTLIDRGSFALKGFPTEQRLYEVSWAKPDTDDDAQRTAARPLQ
jgi:class 3 adenylate cyclase